MNQGPPNNHNTEQATPKDDNLARKEKLLREEIERKLQCNICFDVAGPEAVELLCPGRHTLCFPCLVGYLTSLEDYSIARCPVCRQGAGHASSAPFLRQLAELREGEQEAAASSSSSSFSDSGAVSGAGRARKAPHLRDFLRWASGARYLGEESEEGSSSLRFKDHDGRSCNDPNKSSSSSSSSGDHYNSDDSTASVSTNGGCIIRPREVLRYANFIEHSEFVQNLRRQQESWRRNRQQGATGAMATASRRRQVSSSTSSSSMSPGPTPPSSPALQANRVRSPAADDYRQMYKWVVVAISRRMGTFSISRHIEEASATEELERLVEHPSMMQTGEIIFLMHMDQVVLVGRPFQSFTHMSLFQFLRDHGIQDSLMRNIQMQIDGPNLPPRSTPHTSRGAPEQARSRAVPSTPEVSAFAENHSRLDEEEVPSWLRGGTNR